jgi:phosphate-selective porin OprO/OprP
MKIGGMIQLDHYFVDDDDMAVVVGDAAFESGVNARRVRLHNAGLLHGNVEWKLEMDFADPNDPVFADMYIGLVNLDDCFGCMMPNIRVGHFKAPIGLEELTSSKYITFMERSSTTNTFALGYRYGVMLHDVFRGGQLGYALGYFSDNGDFADNGQVEFDEGYGLAARVWWTPWYDCACSCRRLHVGAGIYSLDEIGTVRFRDDGYIRTGNTPDLIDTGNLAAQGVTVWNAELALVYGPWSLQGEYYSATLDGSGDPTFTGWYAQGSYWLTGECRQYKNGVFSRTSPCCNFLENECCCYGGFELAARYEVVDLTDGAIAGGEMTNWTVGLNWHMNPNARIQINYFNINVDGGPFNLNDQDMTGLGVRLQVDW